MFLLNLQYLQLFFLQGGITSQLALDFVSTCKSGQVREMGAVVTDAILVQKALQLAATPKAAAAKSFRASRGWLAGFKNRHGVRFYREQGKSRSADAIAAANGRSQLSNLLANSPYQAADIFNFDETGLLYQAEPRASLSAGAIKGKKASKERLTIALCTNVTGTERFKPFVIGKLAYLSLSALDVLIKIVKLKL